MFLNLPGVFTCFSDWSSVDKFSRSDSSVDSSPIYVALLLLVVVVVILTCQRQKTQYRLHTTLIIFSFEQFVFVSEQINFPSDGAASCCSRVKIITIPGVERKRCYTVDRILRMNQLLVQIDLCFDVSTASSSSDSPSET